MNIKYSTYIIFSTSKDRFYTGYSNDLVRRLRQHNEGKTPSTKYGTSWQLVWNSPLLTKSEALALEKKIKFRGASRFLKSINYD